MASPSLDGRALGPRTSGPAVGHHAWAAATRGSIEFGVFATSAVGDDATPQDEAAAAAAATSHNVQVHLSPQRADQAEESDLISQPPSVAISSRRILVARQLLTDEVWQKDAKARYVILALQLGLFFLLLATSIAFAAVLARATKDADHDSTGTINTADQHPATFPLYTTVSVLRVISECYQLYYAWWLVTTSLKTAAQKVESLDVGFVYWDSLHALLAAVSITLVVAELPKLRFLQNDDYATAIAALVSIALTLLLSTVRMIVAAWKADRRCGTTENRMNALFLLMNYVTAAFTMVGWYFLFFGLLSGDCITSPSHSILVWLAPLILCLATVVILLIDAMTHQTVHLARWQQELRKLNRASNWRLFRVGLLLALVSHALLIWLANENMERWSARSNWKWNNPHWTNEERAERQEPRATSAQYRPSAISTFPPSINENDGMMVVTHPGLVTDVAGKRILVSTPFGPPSSVCVDLESFARCPSVMYNGYSSYTCPSVSSPTGLQQVFYPQTSEDEPPCVLIPTRDPCVVPIPTNGTRGTCPDVLVTDGTSGEGCIIDCHEGYTRANTGLTTYCHNGTLIAEYCRSLGVCALAAPLNGTLGTCPASLVEGSPDCVMACDPGFRLSSYNRVTCAGSYSRTVGLSTCEPLRRCIGLESRLSKGAAQLGTCSNEMASHAAPCQLECGVGYLNSTSTTSCADSYWHGATGCTRDLQTYPCQLSALTESVRNSSCPEFMRAGESCSISCVDGFEAVPSISFTCGADGSLSSGPSCVALGPAPVAYNDTFSGFVAWGTESDFRAAESAYHAILVWSSVCLVLVLFSMLRESTRMMVEPTPQFLPLDASPQAQC